MATPLPLTSTPADPPPPPRRKFPAPCWTQDDTLALIAAYREKWYSLRRRNLRTADWEAVAADVLRRSPNAQGPPKTSAQCRHKMEKLRKRYRAEKQRFVSVPQGGQPRFFPPSSWVLFDLMDSMEIGSEIHNPQISPIFNAIPLRSVHHAEQKPDLRGNAGINPSKDVLGKYFDEILMGMGSSGGGGGGGRGGNPIEFKANNNQNPRQFDRNPSSGVPPPPGLKRVFPNQDHKDQHQSLKRNSNGESKRDSLVSSIRMFGEGLVKMEKMKMEMMREIEKMRMEMEIKRSKMILESQQLILNAFVEGLKNSKANKVMEVE